VEQETAHPLQWPNAWPRTTSRLDARFRGTSQQIGHDGSRRKYSRALSVAEATERLRRELDNLGGHYAVLSTNLELRLNGLPRSNQCEPTDTGAAVYFTLKKKRVVLACDKWARVADNIAAIAAHIAALRGQERWGVGSLEQAFAGYAKLPSPEQAKNWRTVLGCPNANTRAEVEMRFRELSMLQHPDRPEGSHEQMAQLNQAIADARKELHT
jgi:hypothetical protein